jgi:asparagine synthase (glutamine-hydrolysing)
MCGFAGVLSGRGETEAELLAAVEAMSHSMTHRGPDDSGAWAEAAAGIALGFRRLAIQDLSAAGHQPMESSSGRFVITFNGEVYNFNELRPELEALGERFRGHSDTEVILAAFEQWGIRESLPRFVGMFAIGVWDRRERSLTLVRDRLGVKPLHVHHDGGRLAFGSELRSLMALPGFRRAVDVNAAALFLRHLYVPAPATILDGVFKLMPGHLLEVRDIAAALPEQEAWWTPEAAAARGLADPFEGSDEEAIDTLDRLLREAVKLRMIADVPLGAFLSAGIDSSTVVAMMQSLSSRPIRTFSVSFDNAVHDEAPAAALIARHLGTDHTRLHLSGERALELVPRLPEIFDEPHADTSQIPAYLLCAEARKEVTVVLSGDGGDEVFAGYNRYQHGDRMIRRLGRVPRPVRRMAAAAIASVSPASWDRTYSAIAPILPRSSSHRLPGDKMLKMARVMEAGEPVSMYRALIAAWPDPRSIVPGATLESGRFERILAGNATPDFFHRMVLADQAVYLPDDQLAKVDRVSMAVSLEMRVPLLDHRIVEYAWRLPRHLKVRGGRGKWVLRQILDRYVPNELTDRPKMGLSVPLADWLRGPLRPWAEELIDPSTSLLNTPFLDPVAVSDAWRQLLSGRDELALRIWAVLMLQAWAARWINGQ